MIEVDFLLGLALIWIVFATFSDIKSREIPNWLNFSLIVFALGFRFFYSLFLGSGDGFFWAIVLFALGLFLVLNFHGSYFKTRGEELLRFFFYSLIFICVIYFILVNPGNFLKGNFDFFYQGLIGLGVFFILGNLFYYGRVFAGGDVKLMISLGAVLPVFLIFEQNVEVFILFFFLFFGVGGFYGIIGSTFISIKNFKQFKKGFGKTFSKNKRIFIIYSSFGILFLALGFFMSYLVYFGIVLFLIPYLYIFLKSVDEYCMIKEVPVSKLTPGDWLYKDVKIKNKTIRANWDGLSEEEINLIKHHKKKVLVRTGIVFAPVFLISFVLFLVLLRSNFLSFFNFF
ncbi:MAG: prepilin peptidase [Nanoarchaeota archaeon]|nr:prepilin peptidase [Nanoarchaeota archaeon]